MFKHFKRQIAQVLAVAVLLVSIPLSAITAEATSSSVPDEIKALGLDVYGSLIDTSVSAGDAIANHEDGNWKQDEDEWSYGRPNADWKWWRGNTPDDPTSYTISTEVSSENTISFTSEKTDGIILLPMLPSPNYKFEVTFTVGDDTQAANGSFGLVTNIDSTYNGSKGGTMFVVYEGKSSNAGKIYTQNKGKVNGDTKAVETPTWHTAPGAGETMTLTVYAYEGVNYYYVNGTFFKSVKSTFDTEGESLCGIFNSGATVTIKNVSVKKLKKAEEAVPAELQAVEPDLVAGDDLVKINLASGTTLPDHDAEGWEQSADAWSYGLPDADWKWYTSEGSDSDPATVLADNTISYGSNGKDSIILLPTITSSDYKFEATFKAEDLSAKNTGTFGLITNISSNFKDSKGGTMFVTYGSGKTTNPIYTVSKPAEKNADRVFYGPDWYKSPSVGEERKLTVYIYNGKNYYYIDNNYVATVESKYPIDGESLCGFYCYNSKVTISDISVRELRMTEKEPSDGDNNTPSDNPTPSDPTPGDNIDDTNRFPEGAVFDESSLPIAEQPIYLTDFDNETVGELPDGWQLGYPPNSASFGYYNKKAETAASGKIVELDGYGKVLEFSSTNTDAFLTGPDTNTLDYIFEATVIVNFDSEGEFGLANNFYTGINEAKGCMYSSSHNISTGKIDSAYKYRPTDKTLQGTWNASYYPKNEDTVKLKIISYKGYNYICCNDVLCAVAPQRAVSGVTSDNPGFFTYGGNIYITDVKITEIYNDNAEFVIDGANLAVTDEGKVDIDVALSFDKTQYIYTKYFDGTYTYSDSDKMKFGVVMAMADSQVPQEIEVGTDGVTNTVFTTFTQDDSEIDFTYSISVPEENYDKFYTVRPYVVIEGAYTYGEAKAYSAAELANGIYAFSDDDALKEKLADVFADSSVFVGKDAKKLTFTLFSDFHYKEKMYPNTIADLNSILKRADDSNSSFIMSAGDFCNDAKGSPELFNTYLNYYTEEGDLLLAYNIYGNHELETKGNTMENVTDKLTNDKSVVWGTATGEYDPYIAYYYFESEGFRIVCIDTQYSFNPTTQEYEHNYSGSYGAPSTNTLPRSLGPVQLEWLEKVLTEAAEEDIPCIVVGHDRFFDFGLTTTSSDADTVRGIFKKVNDMNPGTVLMCVNGHVHADNQGVSEGVFYFDTNCTRNGVFVTQNQTIYTSDQTFTYEKYDPDGNLESVTQEPPTKFSAGDNTWFYADPLSAVVTINEYGVITVDGTESTWAYGVVPSTASEVTGKVPRISSGTYFTCELLGHNMVYENDGAYHWAKCVNELCDEEIKTVAHTYDQKVVSEEYKATDTTCDAKATYYYSCVCGVKGTETFEVGELAEHSYGEWKVVKEATADEKGLKERECSECGDKQTEEIPVITTDTPGTGDAPSTPGAGDASGTPETGDAPGTPETDDAPGTPGTDDAPSTPGTDDSSETPDNNEDSGTSENEEASANTTDAAKTGDNFNPVLWLVILIMSGAALAVAAVYCRKRKQ